MITAGNMANRWEVRRACKRCTIFEKHLALVFGSKQTLTMSGEWIIIAQLLEHIHMNPNAFFLLFINLFMATGVFDLGCLVAVFCFFFLLLCISFWYRHSQSAWTNRNSAQTANGSQPFYVLHNFYASRSSMALWRWLHFCTHFRLPINVLFHSKKWR